MPPERTRERPSQRTRFRYILFRLETAGPAPDRAALIRELQRRLPADEEPWLTRYDGELGVLRVLRGTETAAREHLAATKGGPLAFTPLLTSGTIASLERQKLRGRLKRDDRRRE